MTAISGRRCLTLSRLSGPLGSLEKTLLGTSRWASTRCFLTWKAKATPQGRLLFRLSPVTPRTDATGAGLWQTPVADDAPDRKSGKVNSRGEPKLSAQVKLWPTPTTQDASNNGPPSQQKRNTPPLNAVVGGSLNPTWVEWLMGYPAGWTDLKVSETPSSRKFPKPLVTQSLNAKR